MPFLRTSQSLRVKLTRTSSSLSFSQSGFSKPTKGSSCLKEEGWTRLILSDFNLGWIGVSGKIDVTQSQARTPCIKLLNTYPDSGNPPPSQRDHFPWSHHGLRGWMAPPPQGRQGTSLQGTFPNSPPPTLRCPQGEKAPSPAQSASPSSEQHTPPCRECQIP